MKIQDKQALAKAALEMRKYSYAPYSKFTVGAALLTDDGRIFTGCNVENASFPAGTCAERCALGKAVSEGCQKFAAIAIAGGAADLEAPLPICAPCGVCRQALREFGAPDFRILLVSSVSDIREYTLEQLLPESFGPDNLA